LIGILEEFKHGGEGGGGGGAIDDAVIASEAEGEKVSDEKTTVSDNRRLASPADTQDADLGIVDDGRGEASGMASDVADGEGGPDELLPWDRS